ncbi:MAG: hypothetical protein JSV86_01755 [Gemmatimonadota bacterium]|nr:MAG: hypothetical protein JSV86_01755 [Gemmatimonadota bacterium]
MGVVWIAVGVVAVAIIAAFLLMRRRGVVTTSESRAAAPVESTPQGEVEETAEIPGLRARVEAAREAEAAVSEPKPAEEVAPSEKRRPSEKELRSRVEVLLEESGRMLGELRKAAEHDEVVAQQAGMVEILEEGLQEVRTLAERKKWSHAKDKGEALHAQLSLMLQSARRERAS